MTEYFIVTNKLYNFSYKKDNQFELSSFFVAILNYLILNKHHIYSKELFPEKDFITKLTDSGINFLYETCILEYSNKKTFFTISTDIIKTIKTEFNLEVNICLLDTETETIIHFKDNKTNILFYKGKYYLLYSFYIVS